MALTKIPLQLSPLTRADTRSQSIPVEREALRFTNINVALLPPVVLSELHFVAPMVLVATLLVIVPPLLPTIAVLLLILLSSGLVMIIPLNPLPHVLSLLISLLHLVLRTKRAGRTIRPPILPLIVSRNVRLMPLTPLLLSVRMRPTTTRVANVSWIV